MWVWYGYGLNSWSKTWKGSDHGVHVTYALSTVSPLCVVANRLRLCSSCWQCCVPGGIRHLLFCTPEVVQVERYCVRARIIVLYKLARLSNARTTSFCNMCQQCVPGVTWVQGYRAECSSSLERFCGVVWWHSAPPGPQATPNFYKVRMHEKAGRQKSTSRPRHAHKNCSRLSVLFCDRN